MARLALLHKHLARASIYPLGVAPRQSTAACFMSGPRKMVRGFGKDSHRGTLAFANPLPMSRGLAMYINKFPEGREAQVGKQAFFPRR